MGTSLDIVVIGAGVAGTATALALARRGHAVRLFERREDGRILGAGVVLWPNATFVLAELGVLTEIHALGHTPPALRRFDDRGASLGHWDIAGLDRTMGFPSLTILRADLQSVLLRAAIGAGVVLTTGLAASDVQGAPPGGGRATVVFTDGTVVAADLVIGADGRMSSVAGRYVRGKHEPIWQGFLNWVGTSSVCPDELRDGSIHDYWGVGRRFGIVPVSGGRAYWAAALAVPTPPESGPRGDFLEDLSAGFAGWPRPIAEVLAHSDPAALRRIALHDLEPALPWHRDGVVLVGDAAHASLPTSGQGTGQALEDAWQLDRHLHDSAGDPATTLAAFAKARFEKTRWMTFAARQFARSLFDLDPRACELRNAAAKAADPKQTIDRLAAGWGEGLPLERSPSVE